MKIHFPNITGSAIAQSGFTGSLQGTASFSISASRASTASLASTVTVSNDAAPTSRYVPFVSNVAVGLTTPTNTLLTNANFVYVPASNTLLTTSSWATNALSSSVTNTTSGVGPYYVTFTQGASGTQNILTDSSSVGLTFNATSNQLTTGILSGSLRTPAGTTTVAPIILTSGSNLTTVQQGAIEFNGSTFYASPTSSARAAIVTEHFCCTTVTHSLTNTTALQKIFGTNVSPNGALFLQASTTYFFECCLNISGMNATAGNIGFSIIGNGSAQLDSANFHAFGYDATTQSTAGAIGGSFSSTGAATGNIVTAVAGTALSVFIKGIIRTAIKEGTIIPSLQLTNGVGTAVVGVNSWFKCYPIGSSTITSIGNWS